MNSFLEKEIAESVYTPEEIRIIQTLVENGQEHLFADWEESQAVEQKKAFLQSLLRVDTNYPGGISGYIRNARRLLEESRTGKNPFAGYRPQPPEMTNLSKMAHRAEEAEEHGVSLIGQLAIVMVAGGLGERLGYPGIKIAIPFELLSSLNYIHFYAKTIYAMENLYHERFGCRTTIPFIIMVSGDTEDGTRRILRENEYYGLKPEQVILLKQELVPAILDNEARLAKKSRYELMLKPHGHGDIHLLMHQTGTAEKLLKDGKKYLAAIQDTNAQVVNALLPALSVSVREKLDFNSIVVPRVAKEAVGGIATLVPENSSAGKMTINVEYNQLDPLLRSTVNPEGDVNGPDGLSPYPGNINVIIIAVENYVKVLKKSAGLVPEFVNPKYADAGKTVFQKPTRLETMMQDLPRLFDATSRVGVTMFPRKFVFSPDKNNLRDAAKKAATGQPPECAASAESDYYEINRLKINRAGNFAKEIPDSVLHHGIPFKTGARIVLHPEFAVTQKEIQQKIKNCTFGPHTSLVLEGKHIYLDSFHLKNQSAVKIKISPDVRLSIRNVTLDRWEGMAMRELLEEEMNNPNLPAYLKIRGYALEEKNVLEINITEKGNYYMNADGTILREEEHG